MNLLLNKKVDAIIMVGSNFIYEDEESNKYIADAAMQVPVMLLNAYVDIANVYSIVSDDFTSMYEATNYMLDTGVTDPIYFYDSTSYSGKKKLSGFKAAMENRNLLASTEQLLFFSGSHEDIPGMTSQLRCIREKGLAFHGVVASNDTLALAAVKYAKEEGLKIPEDLSIIGYNNSMLTQCCIPELTSIDNTLEVLCEHLIKTLMEVFNGKEMPKKSVFSGELVKRSTTL